MLKSLYSGVSGLKNFQTQLDVIGNNIANVDTTGFKEGRVTFKDMFSQTLQNATAPTTGTGSYGGKNPEQVGFGSLVASTDTIDTQGGLQSTGRTLDLAISGDGYFKIKSSIDGNVYYTRAGNFYLNPNSDGKTSTLVTASGDEVLDTNGAAITNIPISSTGLNISSTGQISTTDSTGTTTPLATLGLALFQNPEGLEKTGNNLYAATGDSGQAVPETPGSKGAGSIQSGALEMSNVDLSDQMTQMIVAQRAFQANSKTITTSDQILQEIVNLKQ